MSYLSGKLHRTIKIMQYCSSEKLESPEVDTKKLKKKKCRTCELGTDVHLDQNDYFALPQDPFSSETTIAITFSILPLTRNQ